MGAPGLLVLLMLTLTSLRSARASAVLVGSVVCLGLGRPAPRLYFAAAWSCPTFLFPPPCDPFDCSRSTSHDVVDGGSQLEGPSGTQFQDRDKPQLVHAPTSAPALATVGSQRCSHRHLPFCFYWKTELENSRREGLYFCTKLPSAVHTPYKKGPQVSNVRGA